MADPNFPKPAVNKVLDTKTIISAYFDSHSMSEDQQTRTKRVRDAFKSLAETVILNTKKGADQTAALRKLRESSMTLISSIATEEILP